MGNKQEKEASKANFNECKKEYFRAINQDFKDSMRKINSTLNAEKTFNNENDKWVDYLKNKFDDYCAANSNFNNDHLLKQIMNYLNNIGETNESKHIYNLSIFLKKYLDESIKIKQKNSIFYKLYVICLCWEIGYF